MLSRERSSQIRKIISNVRRIIIYEKDGYFSQRFNFQRALIINSRIKKCHLERAGRRNSDDGFLDSLRRETVTRFYNDSITRGVKSSGGRGG